MKHYWFINWLFCLAWMKTPKKTRSPNALIEHDEHSLDQAARMWGCSAFLCLHFPVISILFYLSFMFSGFCFVFCRVSLLCSSVPPQCVFPSEPCVVFISPALFPVCFPALQLPPCSLGSLHSLPSSVFLHLHSTTAPLHHTSLVRIQATCELHGTI